MIPVVILAGGFATRLRPISNLIPKSLIMINGQPFLEWQLRLLEKNNCEKIIICVSHKSQMIEEFIENRAKSRLHIETVHDGKVQLGTGGAIVKALDLLGESFMVLYGDSYPAVSFEIIEERLLHSRKLALMTVIRNDLNLEPSNVHFDNDMVLRYSKVNHSNSMHFIDYGVSAFKTIAFDNYRTSKHVDLSLIQEDLSAQGDLAGFEVFQRYYEIGSIQGIIDFEKYMRSLS